MNKAFISKISDEFDEYPEIKQTDLNRAIRRRNFVEVTQKQSIELTLDADIVAWFKRKSGESYQSFINNTLRDVMLANP